MQNTRAFPHHSIRRRSSDRTYHLIDAENLAGGPFLGYDGVGDRYRAVVAPDAGDLFTVGTDITGFVSVGPQFPGARLVTGTGPDGADTALMAAEDADWLAARFSTIVIASGDGGFALYAAACRARGLAIVVVARRGSLSRLLARQADRVIWFDDDPDQGPDTVDRARIDAGEAA
jgi:hypothetical protein